MFRGRALPAHRKKALPILTKGEGRIIDLKNVRRLDEPEV
jgi:hypothetical protein